MSDSIRYSMRQGDLQSVLRPGVSTICMVRGTEKTGSNVLTTMLGMTMGT